MDNHNLRDERLASSGYEGRGSLTKADDAVWPGHALEALLDNAAPLERILGLMEGYSKRVAFSTDLIPARGWGWVRGWVRGCAIRKT